MIEPINDIDVKEIREALDAATPGPWHMSKLAKGYLMADCGCSTKDIATFIEYNEDGSVHVEFDNWENNAHLIANAPEWLGFLLDELERLEREYAEERAAHNAHVAQLCRAEEDNRKRFVIIAELVSQLDRKDEENRKLREERDKLIEALRQVDTHIRATPDPVPYIVDTLKRALPEYRYGGDAE